MVVEANEMEELKASIRSNGLRHPVGDSASDAGQYGLISGWRRITALLICGPKMRALPRSRLSCTGAGSGRAFYTAMVEENELRAQLGPL